MDTICGMASPPADAADLLHRLISLVMRRGSHDSLAHMHASGLTMPQIVVLHVVGRGERTMSELAATLAMSLPATSQLVDRLVEAGLVGRAERASDRRVRTVNLRPAGGRFLDRLEDLRRRELGHALATLSPRVRDRLAAAAAEAIEELSRSTP
jgi:DNA-binding MarR family transcriptional regulator